nr:heavy metal-binding domain-containing protein [Lacinutrix sp.]
MLTTTNSIEGFKIIEYKGLVTGLAFNKKSLGSGFSVKKYKKNLEDSIYAVKEEAFQKLQENALKLNANAVLGIKLDVMYTTTNSSLITVIGTAVNVVINE